MTGGFAAGGTWGIHVLTPRQIVFAVIAKGHCWLRLDNHKGALRLDQGDVGLLNGKSGFIIGSSPTVRAKEVELTDKSGRVVDISAERECIVLSCRVSLDPSSASLLTDVLPARVHIRGSSPKAAGDEGIPFRELAMAMAMAEQLGLGPAESRKSSHFGMIGGMIASLDVAASSALTRELTGWKPTRVALLDDVRSGAYARGELPPA